MSAETRPERSDARSPKPAFVGMLVDVALVAPVGWAIGLLAPVDGAAASIGYVLLMQLPFGAAAIGLPLAHEFTGGPRAASWPALASGLLAFVTLAVAITAGAAQAAEVTWAAAFASNATHFFFPFLLWIVVVEGGVAWELLRGKRKQAAVQ